MYDKEDTTIAIMGLGLSVAMIIGTTIISYDTYLGTRIIPKAENVQKGYISPSTLEIECQDHDGNGEPETMMRIKGKRYHLRYENGKPTLTEYKSNLQN